MPHICGARQHSLIAQPVTVKYRAVKAQHLLRLPTGRPFVRVGTPQDPEVFARLRIDQHFASPQWDVFGCQVHREINWSDHFPLEALYQLRR